MKRLIAGGLAALLSVASMAAAKKPVLQEIPQALRAQGSAVTRVSDGATCSLQETDEGLEMKVETDQPRHTFQILDRYPVGFGPEDDITYFIDRGTGFTDYRVELGEGEVCIFRFQYGLNSSDEGACWDASQLEFNIANGVYENVMQWVLSGKGKSPINAKTIVKMANDFDANWQGWPIEYADD